MKDIHDIHDRGYKKLFSNKTIFRQLIETFVHEPWVKDLDFDQCEPLDKSFIADHYKETESDLIYKIRLKGREAYIVILLEFQSTVERFMALRVLNYITNFYMDYVQSNKGITMLPPVFPIVLYNGQENWTAPVHLSALIKDHDLLGRFAIHFEYFPIVEQAFPPDELVKIHNLVSTLFLAETKHDAERVIEEFSQLFEDEEDRQAFWLLVNWFLQLAVRDRIQPEDLDKLEHIITSKEAMKSMLVQSIEAERREYYDRGKKLGILEGQEKGKKAGKLEDAQAMLAMGLAVDLIRKITGLPEEEIVALRDKEQKPSESCPERQTQEQQPEQDRSSA